MTWANNRTAPLRLRGRALQQRNVRILKRDNYVCHICKGFGADTVDHVLALARGGTDDDANVKAAHEDCNQRKRLTHDQPARASKRRAAEPHPGAVR